MVMKETNESLKRKKRKNKDKLKFVIERVSAGKKKSKRSVLRRKKRNYDFAGLAGLR